jgi:hypothetical protein
MPNPTGKGGFKKGVSGNPAGPAIGQKRNPADQDVKRLARTHTAEAVAGLMEIARDKRIRPETRAAAYNSVLDRGHGRPHQSIDIEAVVNKKWTEMTLEDIYALERLRPIDLPPQIEGISTPVEEPFFNGHDEGK